MWILIGVIAVLGILVLIAVRRANFLGKTVSIYYDPAVKPKLDALYDQMLSKWPVPYETRYVVTKYGRVHVIICGREGAPPMLLMHAASVTSMSWIDNVADWSDDFRIYAIDTIGEPGKSELADVNAFPHSGRDLAELYTHITRQLGVERAYVVGASYGGFIAANYALYAPERVEKIALLGAMGVTPNTAWVAIKLTLFTFYPVEPFKRHLASWSLGNDPSLDWCLKYFRLVLDGVQGRFFPPATFKKDELENLKIPVLVVLGRKDNLVGDPVKVREFARRIPDHRVEILDTAHLIGVEQPKRVNALVLEYFDSLNWHKLPWSGD